MKWENYRAWRLFYIPRIRLWAERGEWTRGGSFWRLILAVNDRQFTLIDRTTFKGA